jgi:hypothetical protein
MSLGAFAIVYYLFNLKMYWYQLIRSLLWCQFLLFKVRFVFDGYSAILAADCKEK